MVSCKYQNSSHQGKFCSGKCNLNQVSREFVLSEFELPVKGSIVVLCKYYAKYLISMRYQHKHYRHLIRTISVWSDLTALCL